MLDRIMDQQDRFIYSCKYFHGHRMSSEYSVRSWALLYNFGAIPAAAMGMVAPWLAAIGMSVSSLIVVLNATRLTR